MTRSDTDMKQLVKQHNRKSLVFFLVLFVLFQLLLIYLYKSFGGTLALLTLIEAVSLCVLIFSVFIARFDLKQLKSEGSFLDSCVEQCAEIGLVDVNADLVILQLDLDGVIQWAKHYGQGFGGAKTRIYKGQKVDTLFEEATAGLMKEGLEQVLLNKGKIELNNQEVVMGDGRKLLMCIQMTYVNFQDQPFILWVGQDKTKEWTAINTKDIIMHFDAHLAANLSPSLYYDSLMRELVAVIPAVDTAYLLLEGEDGLLRVRAHTDYATSDIRDYVLEMKESLFFRHCGNQFRRSLILEKLNLGNQEDELIPLKSLTGTPIESMLSCPIYRDGKLVGLINLESLKHNAFQVADLEWMDFIGNHVSKTVSTTSIIEQGIYLSKYDPLTGLFNRWQLDEFERNTLPHCIRYKESFLFVAMTLNHLEQINHHHGYSTGDLYLMTFSKLLRNFTRETDLIFRMGGDRFVGIFFTHDVFTMGGKLELMEQSLGTSMTSDLVLDGNCSFAYGMVSFPGEGQSILDLYSLARERMTQKALEMESDVRYANKT